MTTLDHRLSRTAMGIVLPLNTKHPEHERSLIIYCSALHGGNTD